MRTLYLVLYILAAVCFALAVPPLRGTPSRLNLVALGLLAWVLVPLIETARASG